MMKVLLLTISFFLLVFLESFLLKIFSFSLFAVLTVSFWKKVDHIVLFVLITLFTLFLDTVLHTPLGVHMLSVSLCLLLVEFLWFLIPREGTFGFVPVLFFVFLYNILVLTFTSLLRENIFPFLSLEIFVKALTKGIFSIPIYLLVTKILALVRKDDVGGKIRLR